MQVASSERLCRQQASRQPLETVHCAQRTWAAPTNDWLASSPLCSEMSVPTSSAATACALPPQADRTVAAVVMSVGALCSSARLTCKGQARGMQHKT